MLLFIGSEVGPEYCENLKWAPSWKRLGTPALEIPRVWDSSGISTINSHEKEDYTLKNIAFGKRFLTKATYS